MTHTHTPRQTHIAPTHTWHPQKNSTYLAVQYELCQSWLVDPIQTIQNGEAGQAPPAVAHLFVVKFVVKLNFVRMLEKGVCAHARERVKADIRANHKNNRKIKSFLRLVVFLGGHSNRRCVFVARTTFFFCCRFL